MAFYSLVHPLKPVDLNSTRDVKWQQYCGLAIRNHYRIHLTVFQKEWYRYLF
ncbi:hypothetical protein D3C86_2159600 [compost metagenome]